MSEEFRLLKRSISASGILGLLLPAYAHFAMKGESEIVSFAGFTLLVFSAIHLSYLRRLEKRLRANGQANHSPQPTLRAAD
jgi:hypothetical protein